MNSGNEQNIVDPKRMQDLVDSLGNELRDVIETYLDETPRQIEELRAALSRGDWDDLQRIAHSLKSSSGIFGARRMVDLCHMLEARAAEGQIKALERISAITESFEQVRVVLNLYLEND